MFSGLAAVLPIDADSSPYIKAAPVSARARYYGQSRRFAPEVTLLQHLHSRCELHGLGDVRVVYGQDD